MKNIDYIIYTYAHRKIILKLAEKYLENDENKEKYIEHLKFHDVDKLFMLLFLNKQDVSKIHRNFSKHHDNEIEKKEIDYIEMVLDWESARYTKPDKPLNAYDTLYKYYPQMEEKILPILIKFGIDKSDMQMDEDIYNYALQVKNASITKIKQDMKKFIDFYFEQ